MTNEEIKKKLDCTARITGNELVKSALNIITVQEEEIDDLKAEIKHLNTIVERLDELLGKGINDYIMGIDGVEGIKDMWERSAVREFAGKVKEEVYPFLQAEMYNKKHFITGDSVSDKLLENQNIGILKAQDVLSKWFKVKIDELLKEYE